MTDAPASFRRLAAVLVVLSSVLLGVGCGSGDDVVTTSTSTTVTTSAESADPLTVVVLGSSTAAGFGLDDPADGWVERFGRSLAAHRPGSEVVNLAVPGFTTFSVLPADADIPAGRPVPDAAHNIDAALDLDPDAIVVNLPSNDAAIGVPADEQMANFATLVEEAEDADVEVWVTTTQPRDLDDEGRALLVEVGDRVLDTYGDRAIDVWTGLVDGSGRLRPDFDQGDGIHLTPAGHEAVFDRVDTAGIGD